MNDIITSNDKVKRIIEQAKKVATSDINILITGENGVGKNVFANAIHNYSKRKDGPLISINCAAIPDNMLELELFGCDKGDGKQRYIGKFEQAFKGTLVLDEIGEMPLVSQGKIVKVIEEKRMQRIGGNEMINIDVRIIATTSKDILKLVNDGKIREDFYFRLNEISFMVPPLRDRKEDIPLLINHFIKEFNQEFNKKVESISHVALTYLLNYEWPGNIRELRNLIRTAMALSEKNQLWLEDIPLKISISGHKSVETEDNKDSKQLSVYSLKHAEKEHILKILNMNKWNKSKSAKLLGISRPRLDRKMQEFGLKKPKKEKGK